MEIATTNPAENPPSEKELEVEPQRNQENEALGIPINHYLKLYKYSCTFKLLQARVSTFLDNLYD